jgi:hypothetical protein
MPATRRTSVATDDQHGDEAAPAVPRQDAGPRPGEHPTVARSGGGGRTGIILAAVLGLALLMYAAIAAGIFGG